MVIIKAKYPSPKEFADAFLDDLPHGGLFVPTRARYKAGQAIVVYVRFPGLRSKVLVRGKVAWHRSGRKEPKVRAGIGVQFPSQERHTRDFLLSVAKGAKEDPFNRRFRRLPVHLNIEWRPRTTEDWNVASLADISMGGTFVKTPAVLPVGTTVVLGLLAPGGVQKILLEGTVAWISKNPARQGLGVEFHCRDLGGKRLVREVLRRLEQNADAIEPGKAAATMQVS